jgi:hypothetical protein
MANRRFIDFPVATTVGANDIILIWQDGLNKQTTKATILSGLPEDLEDLADVNISGLTNGQILRYDSTTGKWENTDQGNLDLNDLNDVSIVSPSNGQVLVYNSSTSKWENSSGGFVPYTGAVTTVNLGAQTIQAGSFVKQGGTSAQFLKADGSVDSTAYGTGSVTSVGLTMPSAFNVGSSPITTNGTLAVTGAGTTAQYVRGDGSLATFPGLTGFVPYTGATADVNLGTHDLTAERGTFENNGSSDTLTVNHTSGSGKGINVSKGGNGEALLVTKTSGSGNAMSVVGGRTALVDLSLSSVSNATGNFLTISGGVVHQRTPSETRSDVGAQAQLNGTGFVKASGTTITYDNSTYQVTSEKAQPNGYASLDSNGKVPLVQINDALIGNVNFQGLWNASTNTPTLANPPAAGTKGYYYIVSTAGTFAGISFEVGDWIISNGTAWGKVDNTDAVSSVFGRTGNVTASNGDYNTSQVTENTNLYFTNARAIASVLTGYSSGSGTISAADTILSAIQKLNGNIGALVTGVSSVNGQTGVVVLTTTNIAEGTNLYYTEARVNANTNVAANTAARHAAVTLGTANGLSLSTQQLSLGLASAGVTGALSGTDWSTFNSKVSSQWVTSGSNIYYNTGNVGIGTNNPGQKLEVVGNIIANSGNKIGFRYDSNDANLYNYITQTTAGGTAPLTIVGGTMTGSNVEAIRFETASAGSVKMSIFNDGAVAINTISPDGKFDVNGTSYFRDNVNIYAGKRLFLDGGSDTYITEVSANNIQVVTGGLTRLGITSDGNIDFVGTATGLAGAYFSNNNTSLKLHSTFGGGTTKDLILQSGGSAGAPQLILKADGNVLIGTPTPNGNTLRVNGTGFFDSTLTATQFIRSGGTSSQFLKADGSVDSNTYYLASNPSAFIALTALSGTAPIEYNNTTGAISITQASGSTNGFLSSTDWNTFNNKTSNVGTVTSVAALTLGTTGTDLSSTVANGTTTPVITLNVPTASAANRGALSAADWTTFNGKQDNIVAGTTAQYYRGDKTFQTLNTSVVPELTNLYYTEARVNANTNVAANTAARHAAVTLGITNGLGLTGQELSLGLASSSANGALSSTDWTTFNNKQNALTNPVTGTGTTNFVPKFTGTSTIGNSQVFDNGTSVGINTATPSSSWVLDVWSNNATWNTRLYQASTLNTAYNSLFIEGAMTGAKAYFGIGGSATGNTSFRDSVVIGSQSSHSLVFNTADAQRMVLNTSGNLGLGVTPSAWNTGYRAIQVGNSGALWSVASGNDTWLSDNVIYDSVGFKYINTSFATAYNLTGGTHAWYNAPSGTAGNAISFTQAMTLGSNSGLSIGTPSEAPAQGLLVQGNVGIGATTVNVGGWAKAVTLQGSSNAAYEVTDGTVRLATFVAGSSFGGISVETNHPLAFYTNATERMRITSSGNVGIGTNNPGQRLEVNGNIIATPGNKIGFRYDSSDSNLYGYITRSTSGGTAPLTIVGGLETGGNIEALRFETAAPGNARMSIFNNGDVGINTLSPSGKFDVNGTSYFRDHLTLYSGKRLYLDGGSDTYITEISANDIQIVTTGAERLRVTSTGTLEFLGAATGLAGAFFANTNSVFQIAATFGGGTTKDIVLATGGSASAPTITFKAGGNLLIGTATDNANKLRVNGSIWADDSVRATSFIVNTSGQARTITTFYPSGSLGDNIWIGGGGLNSTTGGGASSLGSLNTSLGVLALQNNTTGYRNTSVGYSSLRDNTTGHNNTSVGEFSMWKNTTGYINSAFGASSLNSNTTGYANSAFGTNALGYITTGRDNVAVGFWAGFLINSGGNNTTSSNSTYLGQDTRASADGNTNEVVIGSGARGQGSNSVVIGNGSITKTILRGDVLIGTETPVTGAILNVNGNIRTAAPTGTAAENWRLGRALLATSSDPEDRWIRVQLGTRIYDILAIDRGLA